jgi:hypothetical protein
MKTSALLPVLLIMLFCPPAFAQKVRIKNIAVVEIDMRSGVSENMTRDEGMEITSVIRREAVNNLPISQYNVMTTETVMSMGAEILEDCVLENCVITLGAKIGADYIVRGVISKFQTMFSLTVELYETDYGNLIVSAEAVRSENLVELLEKSQKACIDMYQNFLRKSGSEQKSEPKPESAPEPKSKPDPEAPGTYSRKNAADSADTAKAAKTKVKKSQEGKTMEIKTIYGGAAISRRKEERLISAGGRVGPALGFSPLGVETDSGGYDRIIAGFHITGFFDVTYAEISGTLAYGYGDLKKIGNTSEGVGYVTFTTLNLSVVGKLPISTQIITTQNTIKTNWGYLAAGIEYRICLSARIDDDDHETPGDLNALSFKFGSMREDEITPKIFIKYATFSGLRLKNKAEKNYSPEYEDRDHIFSMIVTLDIGLGFRF